MCGRFYIGDDDPDEMLMRFLDEADEKEHRITGERTTARGEVFPTDVVAALANSKSGLPTIFPMRWGLKRPQGGLIINARAETAAQKPMFCDSLRQRRCLVLCTHYFEWERRDAQLSFDVFADIENKRPSRPLSIKYALRPKEGGLYCLAGLYRYEAGNPLPALVIITTQAAPNIAFLHDRMPLIFPFEQSNAWLSCSADAKTLLDQGVRDLTFSAV